MKLMSDPRHTTVLISFQPLPLTLSPTYAPTSPLTLDWIRINMTLNVSEKW